MFVSKYNSCSLKCSTTLQYFLGDNCTSSCPAGTFLLDDLVTCQSCNPVCAECYAKATNCTKCQGTFWYNYNCVDQCPDSYYVDSSKACRQCSNDPTKCSLPPLSFSVSMTTIDYGLYADVTFNRAIVLTSAAFAKVAQLRTSDGPIYVSEY